MQGRGGSRAEEQDHGDETEARAKLKQGTQMGSDVRHNAGGTGEGFCAGRKR